MEKAGSRPVKQEMKEKEKESWQLLLLYVQDR